jgi:hypothetical protein
MIQDDGEIAPAFRQAELGDVAHPDLVGLGHRRRPHPIRMLGEARATPRLGARAAHGLRPQPSRSHETSDAATTHRPSVAPQIAIDPRTAVALVMHVKEACDVRCQLPVLERARTGRTVAPRIEARPRDAVAPTQGRDLDTVVLRSTRRDEMRDEREPVALRALQNRMAVSKRSCSSLSSAYCRSRRCSCAISRAGPTGGALGGRPRSRPSFTSFRHLESMKGWSAAATVLTCIPGC